MNSWIIRTIKISSKALFAHRGRSIMTMAGIVIGITLVTLVMSAGNAIRAFIIAQVESFGSDIIEVEIKVPGTMNPVGVTITTLKESDAEAIRSLPNIKEGYAGFLTQAAISREGTTKKAMIFGAQEPYVRVDKAPIAEGRFFSESEDASMARVIVIGSGVRDSFFADDEEAAGELIRINNTSYRVVGVFEERGSASFVFDRDNMVVMPLNTVQRLIAGVDYISFAIFSMDDPDKGLATKDQMLAVMSDRHNIDDPDKYDFNVFTIEEAREIVGTIIVGIEILLLALASISLIVGGVGIMNIMYVSVSERTFEIGLRKSVGAKNKDILLQFLTESSLLTLGGGIVGVILGILLSYLIAVIATARGFSWEFSVSIGGIIVAVAFSFAVGVIFGLWPAKKAASLDPIVALRK